MPPELSQPHIHSGEYQAAQSPATKPQVKEHGFTLLSDGIAPEADIFFIHGLQGHPRNTWTFPATHQKSPILPERKKTSVGKIISGTFRKHRESDRTDGENTVFWPLDLAPKDFPNVRIFTYGYDSHVTHWFKGPAMQLDIFSYGESLLNGIEARRRECPDRPLIFIVHSLGGLIIKDALRRSRSSSESRFKSIYLSTKAILFLGTPHRGGSYVNLGLTARKILVCSGFDASDKLLRDLKFDSSTAKLLSEEFAQILDETKPIVYTFQEAFGLSGFGPVSGKVVEDTSSALDYARQEKDVIHANHVDMCRFSGRDDDGYEKIKAALSRCLSMDFHAGTHKLYQSVLASLYLPDLQERFDQVEDAYEGTFQWLFDKKELGFAKWLQSGTGIFWISGKPASGKSTLLKYAVSHPQTLKLLGENNPRNHWICGDFFFTNRGKQSQKNIEGLLQRMLYQFLSQEKALLPFIERIFKEHAEYQGEWTLIYLEDALMSIVRQRKVGINLCLFIDALDEHNQDYHENHSRLVYLLQNLVQNADGKIVKVILCLTSRPENVFVERFQGYPGFPIHEHTQVDVQTYVYSRMGKYLEGRRDLSSDPQVMATLNSTLAEVVRRAQGVFLWVKLVITDFIEGLVDGDSPFTLQKNLVAIPGDGDLQELYSGILLRLRPKYLFESFFMLQIAYATVEPMPLETFFQALDITIMGDMNYTWSVPSRSDMERKLASRCRGFLEVQTSFTQDEQGSEFQGPIVQFLHQSVKDFLRDSSSFDNIKAKLIPGFPLVTPLLSENGHAYLLRFRIQEHFRRYGSRPEDLKLLRIFDLRKFDVMYHAYMVETQLKRCIFQPLDDLSEFADRHGLVPFYLHHGNWQVPRGWEPTFLVLAVQAGLEMYVRYALQERLNIHALRGRPLLHWAVLPMPQSLSKRLTDPFLRSPKMVQLLVDLGANVECQFEGLTAFGFVFMESGDRGHASGDERQMLETLLRLGANPETVIVTTKNIESTDSYGRHVFVTKETSRTALQFAIQRDDVDVANLLLQYNARIDSLSEEDWKFLRKGYLYGDTAPDFEPKPGESTQDETPQEQLHKWIRDRNRAIREGKNTKPMLRLVEEYQSGRRLTVTTRSRRPSSQNLHSGFNSYQQLREPASFQGSAPTYDPQRQASFSDRQDGLNASREVFLPIQTSHRHNPNTSLRSDNFSSPPGNHMLSVPSGVNNLRRSASTGQPVPKLSRAPVIIRPSRPDYDQTANYTLPVPQGVDNLRRSASTGQPTAATSRLPVIVRPSRPLQDELGNYLLPVPAGLDNLRPRSASTGHPSPCHIMPLPTLVIRPVRPEHNELFF